MTIAAAPALLIAGHGTRSEAGAAQFRAFVDRVRAGASGIPVAGGFIELSSPPLADAVAGLVGAGHTQVAAVPLTLVAAGHAKGDIPGALAREKKRHPGLGYTYGRPLGPHPVLLSLLDQRLRAICAPDEYGATTVLLVGRGSTDPDANAEVCKMARLLWEGRGLAGVEVAFISLAQPGVAAGLERCRRLGAGRVVVLPYFLFDGVLPDRVGTQAVEWAAAHHEVDVRVGGLLGVLTATAANPVGRRAMGDIPTPATTRDDGLPGPAAMTSPGADPLAELVLERYREAVGGDIRMSCDTCMYRVALPGFEHRVGEPQHPHDHPDDPAGHIHDHVHHGGPGHEQDQRLDPAPDGHRPALPVVR